MEPYKKYVIIAHGSRYINTNYDDSHFEVPENFNIITITQPDETIYDDTIKIFINEINKEKYIEEINLLIDEEDIKLRASMARKLEKEILLNYLYEEIDKDPLLKLPLNEEDNQFENFLDNHKLYQINFDQIKDIKSLKAQLKYQLDKVKNQYKFEIRIYPSNSQATIMSLKMGEDENG